MKTTDELLIDCLAMMATTHRLNREIKHITDLVGKMRREFFLHQPIGKLEFKEREILETREGYNIHLVRYEDSLGNSCLATEGYYENGDLALKNFYFGFAVYHMVQELNYQGCTQLPGRFLRLLDRHPKFLSYINEEFRLLRNDLEC